RSAGLDADWWAPLLRDVTESDKLSVPSREALLPRLLQARDAVLARYPEEARRRYGGGGWTTAISGPMDLACRLMGHLGYQLILIGFYRHPREVHRLFDVLARANVEWVKLCLEVLGDVRVLHFADHGLALISPRHFPVFGLPYWRREVEAMPRGSIIWYHNEGDVSHLLDAVPEMGVDVFEFGWVDIKAAKTRIGDRVCLLGNIDPTTVLLRGSPTDVIRECRNAISIAAPGGGYILSSRGGETPRTPIENIDAMYTASLKYGKYPSLTAD
ncbi:MAG: uroporphyrinogen decarboxylase family protein, partial [Candidatus Bathyarchaeia archaeon]